VDLGAFVILVVLIDTIVSSFIKTSLSFKILPVSTSIISIDLIKIDECLLGTSIDDKGNNMAII